MNTMHAIKTLLITVYAVVAIMVLSLIIGVSIASLLSLEAGLVIQMLASSVATYIIFFPVIKLRKRLLSLVEKLLIIIPLVTLIVVVRISMSFGNTGMTEPDLEFWVTAVLLAITEFIPVWLVMSTYAYRIYKMPNQAH